MKLPRKKLETLRFFADRSRSLSSTESVRTWLKRLAQEFNDEHFPMLRGSGRYDVYYRNHIYPAEIEMKDSMFYKADIRLIDAILIHRDPSPSEHRRHRHGGYF